jgi:hypothetical protein
MFVAIEQFFQAHQYTVAAVSAFSTLAAVLVSLGLALIAQRSSHTRIKVHVSARVIMHPSLIGKPKPEYVTASITNVGNLSAHIPFSFFHWKIPFNGGRSWMVNPWDYRQHDPWVPLRHYPAEIKPRGSMTVFLSDLAGFRTTMAEAFNDVHHFRWRLRFIKAVAVTEDGRIFKVKVDKKIKGELAKARETSKSLKHV